MSKPALTLSLILVLATGGVSQTNYGTGTPGPGGVVPRLTSGQAWMGNTAFSLDMAGAPGGAAGWLVVSFAPAAVTSGSTPIWVDFNQVNSVTPVAFSGSGGAPGQGAGSVPAPLNFGVLPYLAGLSFYAQAFIPYSGGVAVSAGLEITLTMPPEILVSSCCGSQYVIDPQAQTLAVPPSPVPANGIYDAISDEGGRYVYLSADGAGGGIFRGDASLQPPAYTPLGPPRRTFFLRLDEERQRLWAIADNGSGDRDLVVFDVDPASSTFGNQIDAIPAIGNVAERFALSGDGNRAVVQSGFGTTLVVYDTDPASPTYKQILSTIAVPTNPQAVIAFVLDLAFAHDGDTLLVPLNYIVAPGMPISCEIARYSLSANAFIDHDSNTPLIDNIGPSASPPVTFEAVISRVIPSRYSDRVALSGLGVTPWAGTLDLSPTLPAGYAWTPVQGVSMSGPYTAVLDPEGKTLAVPDTSGGGSLYLFDAASGVLLNTVALPGGNFLYSVIWR